MTQNQLDIAVTNAKCCMANMGARYVDLVTMGDISAKTYGFNMIALGNMINSLEMYDLTTPDACMTEDELCKIIERISIICSECGC